MVYPIYCTVNNNRIDCTGISARLYQGLLISAPLLVVLHKLICIVTPSERSFETKSNFQTPAHPRAEACVHGTQWRCLGSIGFKLDARRMAQVALRSSDSG